MPGILEELLEGSLKYARTSERIVAAITNVASTAETLDGVLTASDADLLPELRASLDGLMAANGALQRAHAVATVQWDLKLAALRGRLAEEGVSAL